MAQGGFLPERSATSKEGSGRAGTHFHLANIWSRLLSASEHLRFNEEKLVSKTQTFEDGIERDLTGFNLKLNTDILFRVARAFPVIRFNYSTGGGAGVSGYRS
jgi:hypothetical protein